MKPWQAASAAYPGLPLRDAVTRCQAGFSDGGVPVECDHVQLCVQHPNRLDEVLIDELRVAFPWTRFRPHANVRLGSRLEKWDASTLLDEWPEARRYFHRLRALCGYMRAPAYTLHAGRRAHASLADMLDQVKDLEQWFGIPVGVEGLYPGKDWLLATWDEYAELLKHDVRFAIDLSHLNIVAHRARVRNDGLVKDLLASPNCIEVHVSANDGRADRHFRLDASKRPWWWALLDDITDNAVIFTEGRQDH